jgi:hypothetical protein
MQQPFWDASVALKQYELSDIVETASGLHLIQRWNADPEKVMSALTSNPSEACC